MASVRVSHPQQVVLCLCQGVGEGSGVFWLFRHLSLMGSKDSKQSLPCEPWAQIEPFAPGLLACLFSRSRAVASGLYPIQACGTFKTLVFKPRCLQELMKISPSHFSANGFGGVLSLCSSPWAFHFVTFLLPLRSTHDPFLPHTASPHLYLPLLSFWLCSLFCQSSGGFLGYSE